MNNGPSKIFIAYYLEPVNIILYGKRNFADVIKVLKGGNYPGLPTWAKHNHKAPNKWEGGQCE